MVGHKTPWRTVCIECNHEWSNAHRYYRWPISIKWTRPINPDIGTDWFTWHGRQIRTDNTGCAWFGRTFHLGRLKILFGPRLPVWVQVRPPKLACPACGVGFHERRWQRDIREVLEYADV